jgi:hypothetical protein
MNDYILEKAGSALRELCSDADFATRVQNARVQIILASHRDHLSSCPPEVAEALVALNNLPNNARLKEKSYFIQSAIYMIFLEAGRAGLRLDPREHQS